MADHSSARFGLLRFEPGNPEFPTLPDGIDSLHIIEIGRVPGLQIPALPEQILEKHSAPAAAKFTDWFLDGIWRQPDPIDFGNVTASKQRQMTIHNTSRSSIQLTAIDLSALSGVTAIAPGLPRTIEAFDTITLTFEAGVTGNPAFDDDAILTIDGLLLPTRMLGRRVIIFNMLPDVPIVESVSWLTDNMVSIEGPEQAFSLRRAPRSKVVLTQKLTDDVERTTQQNLIQGAGFLRQGVAMWWQARQITSAALLTDTVIQADTTDMEIRVDGDISFYNPNDHTFVEAEVQSFTVSAITLSQQIGIALPENTFVMPLTYGFQSKVSNFGDYPSTLIQRSSITFNLLEYVDIGALDMSYFTTHPTDGLPIITASQEFDGALRIGQISQDLQILDSATGDNSVFRREVLGRWGQNVLVRLNSMTDQHAWRQFLHFIRGSWGAFYIPTNMNDLPLDANFTLGGNTFTMPSMGTESLINERAPRRDLKLVIDGTTYYRRITAVSDNGTIETVTLDGVIPGSGSIPVADCRISWLTLSRIVGDSATFKHTRLGEAELRFVTRGVIV